MEYRYTGARMVVPCIVPPVVMMPEGPLPPPLDVVAHDSMQVDETLRVEFRRFESSTLEPIVRPGLFPQGAGVGSTDVFIFSEGVRATYDVTELTAEQLIVARDRKVGYAEGQVRLVDPIGTLDASSLAFDWGRQTGEAKDVRLEVGTILAVAGSLRVQPTVWTARSVVVSTCGRESPSYALAMPSLVLRPGRSGRTGPVTLRIGGRSILTTPPIPFSLDNRETGFRSPVPSYRAGRGLGFNWSSGITLGEYTTLHASVASYPKTLPGYALSATYSPLPPERASGVPLPRSDLNDWFGRRYFDNVEVGSPRAEVQDHRRERIAYSIGTFTNQRTRGREESERIFLPVELVWERGGAMGRGGLITQIRGQQIRVGDDRAQTRVALWNSFAQRGPDLTPKVRFIYGLDTMFYAGGKTSSGWARATLGAIHETGGLRLGAAWVGGIEGGKALYPFDQLYSRHGVHLRADLALGTVTLGCLLRYDLNGKGLYDREYLVRARIGCFEPFFASRQFPSEFRFGVSFRFDEVTESLRRRGVQRPGPTQDDW